MYITANDIKHEVSLYYPTDNRNGDKKSRTSLCLLRLHLL